MNDTPQYLLHRGTTDRDGGKIEPGTVVSHDNKPDWYHQPINPAAFNQFAKYGLTPTFK